MKATATSNQPSLPTLTPASIQLIEEAATARYGLRLRYAPENRPEIESDPEPVMLTKKAPTNKPAKEPAPKKGKVIDADEVLAYLKKHGPVAAERIIDLWADKDEGRRRYKKVLAALGDKIVKDGKNRGMRYSARAD